jgi:threonyl-tRNA synthetase
MLVVGDRESSEGTVSVRERAGGDKGAMSVSDFVVKAQDEIAAKGKLSAASSQLSAAQAES